MTLYKTSKTLPKGAKEISEDEAFNYQINQALNWKPKRDVWPLIYGPGILSGMAAVSGIYFNNYFRNKVKLGNIGRVSTFLPIVFFPTMTIFLTHSTMLKPLVLSQKKWETQAFKSASFQAGLGILYPFMLAPLPAFMIATRNMTFYIPPIKQPKNLFFFVKDLTKPILPNILYLALGQMIIAILVVYLENNSILKINKALVKYDEELID